MVMLLEGLVWLWVRLGGSLVHFLPCHEHSGSSRNMSNRNHIVLGNDLEFFKMFELCICSNTSTCLHRIQGSTC